VTMSPSDVLSSPSFAAYTYLTLVQPLERKLAGQPTNMKPGPQESYESFLNDIEDGKEVNASYATSMPQRDLTDYQNTMSTNPNREFVGDMLSWVQKAYSLGLVNPNTDELVVPQIDIQA